MSDSKTQTKIAEGALQILKNPDSFCKRQWFKSKKLDEAKMAAMKADNMPEAERIARLEGVHTPGGYKSMQKYVAANADEIGTLNNPQFQVCGQGAIFMSAMLQGYEYNDALEVLELTEANVRSIPGVNDRAVTTRESISKHLERGFTLAGLRKEKKS